MLTRIVRPSPALDTFLQPLIGHLTLPQRQHLLEMTDALLVTEDRKTLAALQRQFLDTSDPANWADFLRISPAIPGERCATWKSRDSDGGFRKLWRVAQRLRGNGRRHGHEPGGIPATRAVPPSTATFGDRNLIDLTSTSSLASFKPLNVSANSFSISSRPTA